MIEIKITAKNAEELKEKIFDAICSFGNEVNVNQMDLPLEEAIAETADQLEEDKKKKPGRPKKKAQVVQAEKAVEEIKEPPKKTKKQKAIEAHEAKLKKQAAEDPKKYLKERPEVNLDRVKAAIQNLNSIKGVHPCVKILQMFDAYTPEGVKKEDYAAVIEACEKAAR